jgi:hypothetical protein
METELEHIYSKELRKEGLEKQLKHVGDVIKVAKEKQDYESSHNPEILLALSILEDFLRRRRRICYGGQAINAYLPKKYQFYSENDLPDYDFFSPTPEADIDELVGLFSMKGFSDIGVRLSVHAGTTKVYIQFTPIADITGIDPYIFKRLSEGSKSFDGIYYADPDFLRMMMYLELSRPAGEVERWEKVYERLLLLNTMVPIKKCRHVGTKGSVLSPPARLNLIQTLATKGHVICGLDVYNAIKNIRKVKSIRWFVKKEPVLAYSAALQSDLEFFAEYFSKIMPGSDVKISMGQAVGEIVPPVGIIRIDDAPVLVLIQESACHSYLVVKVKEGFELKIASLDTLITLYYSFLYHPDLEDLIAKPLLCLAHEMVMFSMALRSKWKEGDQLPFLSVTCSGHQKHISSLLKERAARISEQREKDKKAGKKSVGGTGSGKSITLKRSAKKGIISVKRKTVSKKNRN